MIAKQSQSDEAGDSSVDPMMLNVDSLVWENRKHRILANDAYIALSHASLKSGSKKKIKAIKAQMRRIGEWLDPKTRKP